jgi:hypothetical protein
MERHEETAPEGLWEGIDQLITAGGMDGKVSRSHTLRMWGRRVGATAAVAAVAIVLLFIVRNSSIENQSDEVFTGDSTPISPQIEQPIEENVIADNKDTESTFSPGSRPAPKQHQFLQEPELLVAGNRNEEITGIERESEKIAVVVDEEDPDAVNPNKNAVNPEEQGAIANDPDPETGRNDLFPDSGHPALDTGNGHDRLLAMNGRRDHQNQTKWQTGLSMSNAPSGSSETYSGYGTFAVTETVEEQYHFLANDTREQAYTDVKHHQPITFGLTLRYNLNERWSVASGLTYSQLSSELHSGSGNYYYDDRQTLHYIGLPLNIAYTFWQSPKLSAYLTSGGLVEKNVAGRLTSNYYIDDQLEITTRENISTDQLQWSVNTAIGLGYRISNNIGLYAEPGISYYFKNNSELETIYKDNPLHFNLRLGLRFTLGD